MLLDLRSFKVTGKDAQASLGKANITCNKNGIPFDTESPFITSGIRLGTPACTTRGFKEEEFKLVADLISKVVKGLSENKNDNSKIEKQKLKRDNWALLFFSNLWKLNKFMLCPFCREKDTSVVDSRPTRTGPLLEEEDYVVVIEKKDLLLLKEYNFKN